MRNLISEKCKVACALSNFDYVHYLEHYFLSMFFTPKHLKLTAGGMPSGDFVNNPLEGYRTHVARKNNLKQESHPKTETVWQYFC